jgi:hypothetical protein
MGHPQHLLTVLPGPALRRQLLPRIQGEALISSGSRQPDIAAGPDLFQTPETAL